MHFYKQTCCEFYFQFLQLIIPFFVVYFYRPFVVPSTHNIQNQAVYNYLNPRDILSNPRFYLVHLHRIQHLLKQKKISSEECPPIWWNDEQPFFYFHLTEELVCHLFRKRA